MPALSLYLFGASGWPGLGPGADAEQLARLTEPFYRTDSARQRATGGVGRGMYLCQLVAQAHGSRLRVDNAAPGLRVHLILKE